MPLRALSAGDEKLEEEQVKQDVAPLEAEARQCVCSKDDRRNLNKEQTEGVEEGIFVKESERCRPERKLVISERESLEPLPTIDLRRRRHRRK